MATPAPSAPRVIAQRKPRDDEIDVHGLTHVGRTRDSNQDHFLISALRKRVDVVGTSLPDGAAAVTGGERFAFLAMVADGVGGGSRGEEASRIAVERITSYVAHSMRCYYRADTPDDDAFGEALAEAATRCHAAILREADSDPDRRGMATTLTLWLGVWPYAYLLQVGDSRCYVLREGELSQLSRDQTMAQELIDSGVITAANAAGTRWAHTLSSSIGGSQNAPVVTRLEQGWGQVGLLCSDGLTRHVSDERIGERLRRMTSARQVCEALLQDALEDGGTDNITIVVGRTVRRDIEPAAAPPPP